jgi:hypothetical protein
LIGDDEMDDSCEVLWHEHYKEVETTADASQKKAKNGSHRKCERSAINGGTETRKRVIVVLAIEC